MCCSGGEAYAFQQAEACPLRFWADMDCVATLPAWGLDSLAICSGQLMSLYRNILVAAVTVVISDGLLCRRSLEASKPLCALTASVPQRLMEGPEYLRNYSYLSFGPLINVFIA